MKNEEYLKKMERMGWLALTNIINQRIPLAQLKISNEEVMITEIPTSTTKFDIEMAANTVANSVGLSLPDINLKIYNPSEGFDPEVIEMLEDWEVTLTASFKI